jgi:hypothetical protein
LRLHRAPELKGEYLPPYFASVRTYVDICGVQELKRRTVFCHASQNPPEIYTPGVPGNQAIMEEYRGMQLGVKAAEAFVKMVGHKQGNTIAGL